MANLKKYPFKYMIAMVNASSNGDKADKAVSLADLRQATGACYLDAKEVLLFLEYITSFGIITQNDSKWAIETPKEAIKLKKPRMYHYLDEIVGIIELLDSVPKTIDVLARETELDNEILDSLLSFLSSITSAGYLSRKDII